VGDPQVDHGVFKFIEKIVLGEGLEVVAGHISIEGGGVELKIYYFKGCYDLETVLVLTFPSVPSDKNTAIGVAHRKMVPIYAQQFRDVLFGGYMMDGFV
jgi:hypothetical protein